MELTKEQLDQKLKKFITDPDWKYIEDLFMSYVLDLINMGNIDPKGTMSNDQIASEVRGRKLLSASLAQFLNETKLIREQKTESILIKPTSFR